MTAPPSTCDPGRADRVNLARVLSSHEEATVRRTRANPVKFIHGLLSTSKDENLWTTRLASILPTASVFHSSFGAVRRVELIPSVYAN